MIDGFDPTQEGRELSAEALKKNDYNLVMMFTHCYGNSAMDSSVKYALANPNDPEERFAFDLSTYKDLMDRNRVLQYKPGLVYDSAALANIQQIFDDPNLTSRDKLLKLDETHKHLLEKYKQTYRS